MKTFKTAAANIVYTAPKGWETEKHGECQHLHVYRNGPDSTNISWWKFSLIERIKILFGRNIRISIVCAVQPPLSIELDPDKFGEVK